MINKIQSQKFFFIYSPTFSKILICYNNPIVDKNLILLMAIFIWFNKILQDFVKSFIQFLVVRPRKKRILCPSQLPWDSIGICLPHTHIRTYTYPFRVRGICGEPKPPRDRRQRVYLFTLDIYLFAIVRPIIFTRPLHLPSPFTITIYYTIYI